MKTIITGASGLLGREIYRIFKNAGHKPTGTAFSRSTNELQKLDLTDFDAVTNFIKEFQPELVIHSAAERKPDVCSEHPDSATELNVAATKNLAELSNRYGFQLIYISTDYVFDGTSAPYSIEATTNPLNFYGKTKLAGEECVLKYPNNISLRVPVLYGPSEKLSEASVSIIAENLLKERFEQDNWATRYPTLTTDIAKVLLDMAEYSQEKDQLSGIFHWSGDESFTKYSMALAMTDILDIDHNKLIRIDQPTGDTPRPKDCHLDTSRLEDLGICHRTPFHLAIKEVINRLI